MTDLSQQSPTKRPWASKNVTKYLTLYKVPHTAITPPQFVWTIKIARQQTMAPSSNDCRSAKLPQGNLRHANRLFKKHVSWNVSMQKLQLSELAKDGGRDSYGAKRHVIRRYCISATLELRSSDGKKPKMSSSCSSNGRNIGWKKNNNKRSNWQIFNVRGLFTTPPRAPTRSLIDSVAFAAPMSCNWLIKLRTTRLSCGCRWDAFQFYSVWLPFAEIELHFNQFSGW